MPANLQRRGHLAAVALAVVLAATFARTAAAAPFGLERLLSYFAGERACGE